MELKLFGFVLTDGDPHGIEIALIYQRISVSHCKWIGVHPDEMNELQSFCEAMVPQDIAKLKSLLDRKDISEPIRKQLEVLEELKQKCEIESIVMRSENALVDEYLPRKLVNGPWY
ncbi:hypothetical protein ACOME3_007834 [Neoechinorhynchus agilis]